MSTRSAIARTTADGWTGRYHHWDGYPSGLGASIYEQVNGHFGGDVEAALRFYCDEHPAGFSTIVGADLAQVCGFAGSRVSASTPQCYCHGERSGDEQICQSADPESISWLDWAYILSPESNSMAVMEAVAGEWALAGYVRFGEAPPNWEALTANRGESRFDCGWCERTVPDLAQHILLAHPGHASTRPASPLALVRSTGGQFDGTSRWAAWQNGNAVTVQMTNTDCGRYLARENYTEGEGNAIMAAAARWQLQS